MAERFPWRFYFSWSFRELMRGHFWPVVLAIILIVASVFSLFALSERMSQAIDKQGKDALLADMVFESANPPPASLLDIHSEDKSDTSQMTRFYTMLFGRNAMKMVTVKAVQSNYPLRGQLQLEGGAGDAHHVYPGTVWLDKGLMSELQTHIGDLVSIGDLDARVTGEIKEEPGINFNPFRQMPTVYIHQSDLAKTGAIQPGSRVRYSVYINAPEEKQAALKSQIPLKSGDKWRDTGEESRASQIFEKTRQYVSMIVVIIVLMASATLVVTAQSYVNSRKPVIDALRCMGATRKWIIRWLLIQLGLLLSVAITAGLILGIGLEYVLRIPLRPLLPAVISPLTGEPYAIAVTFCLLVVFSSVGIPIRRLWRTDSMKDSFTGHIMTFILIIIPLFSLFFLFRGNLIVWFMLGGIAVLFFVLSCLSLLIIFITKRFITYPAIKLALMRMSRTRIVTGLQLGVLGLSLMLMAVIWMAKHDLFSDWRSVLPVNGPNVFAFNISDKERARYSQEIGNIATDISQMYPILRGRITRVNNENIVDHAGGTDQSDSLRREINFTWADTLPTYNDIVDGTWSHKNGVSVESRVADELKLKVGDILTFVANSVSFSATINSIRRVEWRSMKPNFYFIFTPDVMRKFSSSWLVSYRLLPQHDSQLNQISRSFPTVSVIDLRILTEKIQNLLSKVVWAISLLSGIAVLAGFLLVVTVLLLSIDSRKNEVQIYRTLGASKNRIFQTLLYEFGLMGCIASIVAYFSAEILIRILSEYILNIDSSMHWAMLFVMPVMTVVTLMILVLRSSKSLVKPY
ncbi:ABC transporter permease [Vibrio salinus]|uniref:ABC transporter permease n=1 Tax=Vibrio salinus TaxID=2899784 RepID=UPI001E32A3CB|nr:FtsX-like permease family protein [Vibrio salinus]MCE0496057.1 ABC transporter permease [Vibrio salinus]